MLLFNFDGVQQSVDAYPAVTALGRFGGESKGAYARDLRGVHHLSRCAACPCDVNEARLSPSTLLPHARLAMVGRTYASRFSLRFTANSRWPPHRRASIFASSH
mmetsp:Transcript_40750/g.93549  ORF Transcript_40750/g.93549 Transcript_40750/m.93549 type:complete len:104 (+) Transcript_40750:464-775(+)